MSEPSAGSGRANARAALLGNPSDGYGGKVIAFAFAEFEAEVSVREGSGIDAPDGAAPLIGAALKRFGERPRVDEPDSQIDFRSAARPRSRVRSGWAARARS